MMKNNIYVSVIIPCYNEEENLRRGVLKEVNRFLIKQKYNWEVIISDDGSTDGSKKIIKQQINKLKNFRLLENPHGGKPSALLFGVKSVKGELVLFADMDQSTPIDQLEKLEKYAVDHSVVIGSRGMKRKNFPIYRKIGAAVFMGFRKFMILSFINDTQCGFKLFETKVLKKAFPKLEFFKKNEEVSGWKVTSYDVELLHILDKMGEKIKEVRLVWDDRDKSGSKGGAVSRYFRESKEMLIQILRVKYNDLRGLYD